MGIPRDGVKKLPFSLVSSIQVTRGERRPPIGQSTFRVFRISAVSRPLIGRESTPLDFCGRNWSDYDTSTENRGKKNYDDMTEKNENGT